jgi:hypothetical protein
MQRPDVCLKLFYTIKEKAVSRVVTLLVLILPLDKTQNYPPIPLISKKMIHWSLHPSIDAKSTGQKWSPERVGGQRAGGRRRIGGITKTRGEVVRHEAGGRAAGGRRVARSWMRRRRNGASMCYMHTHSWRPRGLDGVIELEEWGPC